MPLPPLLFIYQNRLTIFIALPGAGGSGYNGLFKLVTMFGLLEYTPLASVPPVGYVLTDRLPTPAVVTLNLNGMYVSLIPNGKIYSPVAVVPIFHCTLLLKFLSKVLLRIYPFILFIAAGEELSIINVFWFNSIAPLVRVRLFFTVVLFTSNINFVIVLSMFKF